MPKFSTGTAKPADKLDQRFSFSGKVRGADVLQRLVEVCGYDLLRYTLNRWEAIETPGWTPKEPCGGCDEEKEAKPELPASKRRRPRKVSND